MALVLGSYMLAGTGLAVMVSALVRTRDQMSGLSPLVSTGLAMLGGCLWPLEVVAPFMQTVAKFTPTGWAVMGLTDVVARNQGIERGDRAHARAARLRCGHARRRRKMLKFE